ncbi:uncharacterized protein [Lepisosteus oculatus]|uniref:uncharacterized protein isoform X1 n=1 Tax=Lepisosteus oculatus TaxID=7918 RepID=UPI0035F5051F
MDGNPAFSLSFLYSNDPIYSLCASDLMTASQSVNNNFIKEQKLLVKTLRKLEQQQLSRVRQLNEEKKQFTLLMKKKLAPRGRALRTPPAGSTSSAVTADSPRKAPVSVSACFSIGSSRQSSAKGSQSGGGSFQSEPRTRRPAYPQSPGGEDQDVSGRKINVSKTYFVSTAPRCFCECGRSIKLLTRSEICLPARQDQTSIGDF